MGHRSYLRHHPRTLPRDARRRRLGRGDKKKGIASRFVINGAGGSVGARSIVLDGPTVGPRRPASELGESRQRPAGPIDRSPTADVVFGTRQSAGLIVESGKSPRAIPSELIRGFVEARLPEEEGPSVPSGSPTAERSSGSINELIPPDVAGPLGEPSVAGSIRRINVVDLAERRPIIGRLIASCRLSSERLFTRADRWNTAILPDEPAANQFSAVVRGESARLLGRSCSSPGGRSTVRAAAMTGRRTACR